MPIPCQRWRRRRDSYRPAGEPIDPRRYGVALIDDDTTARSFIIDHHYSGSYPAARCRVGLYRSRPGAQAGVDLVGVAVFSVPAGPQVLQRWCGVEDSMAAVELGRLVLLDDVEANGETWFLARAFALLRASLPAVSSVLSFSDPLPRHRADGSVVKPGHIGIIYRAYNGRYVGRSTRRTLYLSPAGTVISARALSKLRAEERGHRYAAEQLVEAGAPARQRAESGAAYVSRVLQGGHLRRVRHPGNLAYLWPIGDRRQRRQAAGRFPPAQTPPDLLLTTGAQPPLVA